MRINVVQSIMLTLVLMAVSAFFCLGLFGSIILMLIVFGLINSKNTIILFWWRIKDRFALNNKKKMKSGYERMNIED